MHVHCCILWFRSVFILCSAVDIMDHIAAMLNTVSLYAYNAVHSSSITVVLMWICMHYLLFVVVHQCGFAKVTSVYLQVTVVGNRPTVWVHQ